MLKKLNSMFRPHEERKLSESRGNKEWQKEECEIRLVRSTSLYLMGECHQSLGSSLKRSKSAVSVSSSLHNITAEDRVWMLSRTQHCLQYLQDLIVLRKQYQPVSNLNKCKENRPDPSSASTKPCKSSKKVSASKHTSKVDVKDPHGTSLKKNSTVPSWLAFIPPANIPKADCLVIVTFLVERAFCMKISSCISYAATKPKGESKPAPVSTEAETLAYFDSVIAGFDQENKPKVHPADDTHIDVDFVIATSTSEHSLHSNWILKTPRRYSIDIGHLTKTDHLSRRHSDWIGSSLKRIDRRPMYLPKLVESPIHTLRFKPRARGEDDEF
ncbi:uncharacterized protein C13orf42 [Stegostoma tigrinum]|uniref:uncharacterized protein C13orf42 n=1 Tax=Stegostoma tigrinum TaxID=3053191 RepID=UPI00286FFD0C|nr:uncharacterized protein C13orf42 [Stegostoma tigrinum]